MLRCWFEDGGIWLGVVVIFLVVLEVVCLGPRCYNLD